MRIRIRREIAGIIDGVSLSHFLPGWCYDVSDSLGGYLISSGDADEVSASTPVAGPPDDSSDSTVFGGVVVNSQFDRAADWPRPKRTRRKVR